MKKIKKLFLYFITNPVYTVRYIVSAACSRYQCKVNLIQEQDLIKKLQQGISLIRFGDGDIYIAHGGNQSYQISSKKLRNSLFNIFKSTFSLEYTQDKAPYVIGVPSRYLELSNKELRNRNILQCWLPFKIAFKHYFNKNAVYFDSHIFYQTGSFEKYIIPVIQNKNVIFVSNIDNIKNLKNKKFSSICLPHYIVTQNEDSFTEYDNLLLEIKKYKEKYSDVRVILATGTTSKVLAFELSQIGIPCYDIGWGIMYTSGENELEKQLINFSTL